MVNVSEINVTKYEKVGFYMDNFYFQRPFFGIYRWHASRKSDSCKPVNILEGGSLFPNTFFNGDF